MGIPMTEENLGSGIYLDNELDFSADRSGDLRTSSGADELEKDLSFQMIISISQFLGQPPTPSVKTDVSQMASFVAEADTRISSVDRGNITVSFRNEGKEILMTVPVTTNTNENYELVFNV